MKEQSDSSNFLFPVIIALVYGNLFIGWSFQNLKIFQLPVNELILLLILISINIFDLMGSNIKSLINNKQPAGYHSIKWDATNNLGEPVSAGMYIYTLQAGEFRQVKKMVLLK